jgi:hypothetical protein
MTGALGGETYHATPGRSGARRGGFRYHLTSPIPRRTPLHAPAPGLLLLAPFALADKGPKPKDDGTARVTGVATVPASAASFTGRVLEIRLYKYDPRIADKGADLVEKVEVMGLSHTKGEATSRKFSLGGKEKLEKGMGYYITLFVLDGGKRTHMGRCEHVKEPFNKVLTNGMPRGVKATLNQIKK